MSIKKCFKKRTVLVTSLVMLLMVVGYLNNQLTKSALRQSSRGYKDHEELQLSKLKEDENKDSLEASTKNIEIVESIEEETGDKKTKQTKETSNYFVEHRLSREKERSETLERLNKIIEDENTKEDVRDNAKNELIQLGGTSEMELLLEGIIKGKGFNDTVVFYNNDSTRIVIDKEKLSEQDVMKVLEVVTTETDLQAQDIKIMQKQ